MGLQEKQSAIVEESEVGEGVGHYMDIFVHGQTLRGRGYRQ